MTGAPTTASATVKTARTGGTTVTDTLNMAGSNTGGVVTPDSRGQIIFQGPDNTTTTFWLDFNDGGPRWAVRPVDLPALITSAMTARELSQYTTPSGTTAKAGIPYVANHISQKIAAQIDPLVVPRAASQAARDALFPAPADGDRCYRTDFHVHQTYRAMGTGSRWVTDPSVLYEGTLSSDSAVVTFSNIPTLWRHLKVRYRGRAVGSAAYDVKTTRVSIRLNGDTAANYASFGSIRQMKHVSGSPTFETNRAGLDGSGTYTTAATFGGSLATTPSTSAGRWGGLTNYETTGTTTTHVGVMPGSDFGNLHGGGEISIEDYTSSNNRKPIHGRSGYMDNGGASGTGYSAYAELQGGWSANAAIFAVELFAVSATGFVSGSYFSLHGEG